MNFGQSSDNFQNSAEKCWEIFGKSPIIVVYIINRMLHIRSWIRILSSRARVQLDVEYV